jgi:hypothetical protein
MYVAEAPADVMVDQEWFSIMMTNTVLMAPLAAEPSGLPLLLGVPLLPPLDVLPELLLWSPLEPPSGVVAPRTF